MRCLLNLTFGALLWGSAAVAQEICPGTEIIVDLAQTVLSGRAELNQFEKGRIGAEAAYLFWHYAGPNHQALWIIDGLAAEPRYEEAQDMAAALRGLDGLALIDPDPVAAIAKAGPSLQRAVILADRGETYARLMAAALETEGREAALVRSMAFRLPVYLLADQDDQMRLDVADAAVRHGLLVLAAYLLADRADQTAYHGLMAAHADNAELQETAGAEDVMYSGATLRTGQMMASQTANQTYRRSVFDTLRALWHGTPVDFIMIVLNQTGRDQEVALVAERVLAQVTEGQLDPVADPDLIWLAQYRALADVFGRDLAQGTLGSFDFPSVRVRHFSGSALQSLDIMLARETLGAFVRGEANILPKRPALLADDFPWEMWVEVAQAVAMDKMEGIGISDGAAFAVAAELLAEAGHWHLAAESVAPTARPMERLTLVRDMMLRVDRLCDAALVQPGQAMMQPGMFLWKF